MDKSTIGRGGHSWTRGLHTPQLPHSTLALTETPDHPPLLHKLVSSLIHSPTVKAPPKSHLPEAASGQPPTVTGAWLTLKLGDSYLFINLISCPGSEAL